MTEPIPEYPWFPVFDADALCAEADPDAWFPDKGGSTREVKELCRRCELESDCLEYALVNAEPYGVWGGKTVQERKAILRKRGRNPYPTFPINHGTDGGYRTHWRHKVPIPADDSCGCRRAHSEAKEARRLRKAEAERDVA